MIVARLCLPNPAAVMSNYSPTADQHNWLPPVLATGGSTLSHGAKYFFKEKLKKMDGQFLVHPAQWEK